MAVCKLRLRLFPSWPLYSSCRLMGTAGGDGEPTKFQPPPKPVIVDKTSQATQRKFLSPEFIPPRGRTDPLKYSIERKDMVARRKLLTIPEFYVDCARRFLMKMASEYFKSTLSPGCASPGGCSLHVCSVDRTVGSILPYSGVAKKGEITTYPIISFSLMRTGSILAVTMSDINANDKVNRFVGICTQRSGSGLGATFVLRNIIEGQGVEIRYDLYSPRIQEIQVLKLEKRLDDNLMYLRDALPEYSTFDFDMKVVPHSINEEVPVNQLKVRMKPKPWSKRWERPQFKVQGIRFDLCLKEEQLKEAKKWDKPWLEFDMLKEYDTTKIEETIWKEINPQPN